MNNKITDRLRAAHLAIPDRGAVVDIPVTRREIDALRSEDYTRALANVRRYAQQGELVWAAVELGRLDELLIHQGEPAAAGFIFDVKQCLIELEAAERGRYLTPWAKAWRGRR